MEGFLVLNHFALCPCLYLSWRDVSESRGSPESTCRVPQLTPHHHYLDTVHSVPPPLPSSRLPPSPRQCSPRWLLSLLPDLSSPSSPFSLEVLGTKLPSTLFKVVFCPGQSPRLGINHKLLSSPGHSLRAPDRRSVDGLSLTLLIYLKSLWTLPAPPSSRVCLLLKWNHGCEISPHNAWGLNAVLF